MLTEIGTKHPESHAHIIRPAAFPVRRILETFNSALEIYQTSSI
jgi:hypothetical protein